MKKIGFIGAFEKTDLIIYISKFITDLGRKVLFIDSTIGQRARYIVPTISPSKIYVTEYQEIDIAVGFNSIAEIQKYLAADTLEYDYIFIDIDSQEGFEDFEMSVADKNYFVTAFDIYSLKKGLEIIQNLNQKVTMKKVLYSRDMSQEDEAYLNFLSFYYPVEWEDETIFFPYDQGDLTAIIENQRTTEIKLKNLSFGYREAMTLMVQEIANDVKSGDIKRVFKNI